MGTTLITVKPRVTVPALTAPGALSPAVVNAIGALVVSTPPNATFAGADAKLLSVEVLTLKTPAACELPMRTEPEMNVKVCTAAATMAPAVVQVTVSTDSSKTAFVKTQVHVALAVVNVFFLVASTTKK